MLIVVIFSFSFSYLIPLDPIWRGMATLPGVGSLFIALFKIYQDAIAHERSKELAEKSHYFNLSVTSHMANVAFDKHAAFAEAYTKKVYAVVQKLIADGPSHDAMNLSADLKTIRTDHMPWVPQDIARDLRIFEDAIWDIGHKASALEIKRGWPDFDDHRDKLYDNFFLLIGYEINVDGKKIKNKEFESMTIDKTLQYIREVLGVNQFHTLKQHIISKAIDQSKK